MPGGISYYMCLGGSYSRWYFLTVVFFNLADSVYNLAHKLYRNVSPKYPNRTKKMCQSCCQILCFHCRHSSVGPSLTDERQIRKNDIWGECMLAAKYILLIHFGTPEHRCRYLDMLLCLVVFVGGPG